MSVPIIYALTCIEHHHEGLRYVGQTREKMETRLTRHLARARSGHPDALQNWIRKHGENNIRAVILEECATLEEMDERETYWISRLDTYEGARGLNLTAGGVSSRQMSPALRAKIGATSTGRKHSDDSRARISLGNRYGRNGTAKLSVEKVLEMKRLLCNPQTPLADIGERFGVGVSTVSEVKRGNLWGYVGTNIPIPQIRASRTSLAPEKVREIRRLSGSGTKNPAIARQLGLHTSMVWRVLNTDRYAWVPDEETVRV